MRAVSCPKLGGSWLKLQKSKFNTYTTTVSQTLRVMLLPNELDSLITHVVDDLQVYQPVLGTYKMGPNYT